MGLEGHSPAISPKLFTKASTNFLYYSNETLPIFFSFSLNLTKNSEHSKSFLICGPVKTHAAFTFVPESLRKKSWRYLKVVDSLSRAVISCFMRASLKCSGGNKSFFEDSPMAHVWWVLPWRPCCGFSGNVLLCLYCLKRQWKYSKMFKKLLKFWKCLVKHSGRLEFLKCKRFLFFFNMRNFLLDLVSSRIILLKWKMFRIF